MHWTTHSKSEIWAKSTCLLRWPGRHETLHKFYSYWSRRQQPSWMTGKVTQRFSHRTLVVKTPAGWGGLNYIPFKLYSYHRKDRIYISHYISLSKYVPSAWSIGRLFAPLFLTLQWLIPENETQWRWHKHAPLFQKKDKARLTPVPF